MKNINKIAMDEREKLRAAITEKLTSPTIRALWDIPDDLNIVGVRAIVGDLLTMAEKETRELEPNEKVITNWTTKKLEVVNLTDRCLSVPLKMLSAWAQELNTGTEGPGEAHIGDDIEQLCNEQGINPLEHFDFWHEWKRQED